MIVRRFKIAEQTAGGIILTKDSQKNLCSGEVLAVSPDPKGRLEARYYADKNGGYSCPSLLVSRTVFWKSFAGTEVEVDDTSYFFLEYEDILGVLKETP